MTHNIKVDENEKCLEVVVDTKIFPIARIMRASNDFTNKCYVIMDQAAPEKMLVRLIPHEKTNLKELGYEFNTKLVASFVEDSRLQTITNLRAEKPSQERQRSFIVVTRKCVNDCLFCTEAEKRQWGEPTTQELKDILKSDCKSFSSIVFSGGEPSLRKEIFELTEYAKNLGYYVRFFTNGRLFSNPEIAERAAKAGLNAVLIPLHGYPARIHDRITQRQGSFEQTISGIKNLASHKIEIQLKIIPNKVNYKYLPNLASFITSFPYGSIIGMDMLVVSGNALKNKDIVSTKLSNMVPHIEKTIDILTAGGKHVYVGSLPLCLIKPKYWEYIQNDRVSDEINVWTKQDTMSVITNPGQALTPVCENCLLKNKCPGTWASYFRAYGDSELKPVVK